MKLSVVIPALNEEGGIGDVLQEIPIAMLRRMDYEVEVIVVDNGSVDNTLHIARMHGATVVMQPMRGYGNAYKAGFAYATGDVIATGDADLTYPFSELPKILRRMDRRDLEFINTDRLSNMQDDVMTKSHVFGNWLLSAVTKLLFRWPYKDSQSGMWIFRRYVWDALDVRSSGMPFSQELKIEAFVRGFKCDEVPIEYRARAGKEKLNTITDGLGNVAHLIRKRMSLGVTPMRVKPVVPAASACERGTRAQRRAAGTPGKDDLSLVWEERWYEREMHVARSTNGCCGPHVPVVSDLEDVRSHGHKPIVVWRARPSGSRVSASVSGPSRSQEEHVLDLPNAPDGLSLN